MAREGFRCKLNSVWKVKKDNHFYALKIFDESKLAKLNQLQILSQEIEIMKLLDHSNIIKLYDVLYSKKKIFLVMEYLDYGTLSQLIESSPGKRLSENQARQIFINVLRGITYCHSRNVIHRDIKAENVMINPRTNQVKIIDFGLSAVIASKLRTDTCIAGSYTYMAPEIISRTGFSQQSDVWALGVLLHYMVCGVYPFDDSNVKDLFKKISIGQYELGKGMSSDLVDLLRRIFEIRPNKRLNIKQVIKHPWVQAAGMQALIFLEKDLAEWEASRDRKFESFESKEVNFADFLVFSLQTSLTELAQNTRLRNLETFTTRMIPTDIIKKISEIFALDLLGGPEISLAPYFSVILSGVIQC